MNSIPYWSRLVALLALAICMIVYDRRKGSTARQWEYGCLFLFGAVGAVYGAANDAITAGISPDYFVLGKGLDAGAGLRARAIMLGGKAGFSAGAVACVLCHLLLRRVPAPSRCIRILRRIWIPFVLAGTLAVLAPLVLGHADPLGFHAQLIDLISAERIASFLTVWWTHMGAYLGLIMGLCTVIAMSKPDRGKTEQGNGG